MSMLGEEVIEEWLNRNGYFTIRGVKIGNAEIDLLAIKPQPDGKHECRHIEVQLSPHPMGYIVFRDAKKRGKTEIMQGVKVWVEKKFDRRRVAALKQQLCNETWTKELVIWNVKYEEEVDAIEQAGVEVHRLTGKKGVLSDMEYPEEKVVVPSATARHLFELILAGKELRNAFGAQ